MIDLTFQCALLLLNSSPESLLLTGENDALEVIKIRIEVLSWLFSRIDQSRPENGAERLQRFFSHQLYGQLFVALKGNFELGVLQISHQVIRVYAQILQFKKSGQIFDLHIDEMYQQMLTLSASVAKQVRSDDTNPSNVTIMADLDDCQLQGLKHLDL